MRIQITSCFYSQGEELNGDTEIPIFTDQFLQHNKLRESELRQLRKANSDYEQQVIKRPNTFNKYVSADFNIVVGFPYHQCIRFYANLYNIIL